MLQDMKNPWIWEGAGSGQEMPRMLPPEMAEEGQMRMPKSLWERAEAREMERAGIWQAFLSCLFPRRCPVCGDIAEPRGELICPECTKELQFVKEPVCKGCGREIAEEDGELCGNCKRHQFSFDYGIALLNYNEAAAHSMGQIKYNGRREYLDFYGRESVTRCGERILGMGVDALVPVPVHQSRRRKRGYNQAEILAERIGKALSIPVLPDALRREKNTRALKEQNAAERLRTLRQAFQARQIPPGLQSVCLVDDIFTTGSTIEACTRALLSAGVSRVCSFVLCIRADS